MTPNATAVSALSYAPRTVAMRKEANELRKTLKPGKRTEKNLKTVTGKETTSAHQREPRPIKSAHSPAHRQRCKFYAYVKRMIIG